MSCVFEFASQAKTRITLQEKTTTDDGYGGRSVTWSDIAEVWAAITATSGKEVFSQGQNQSRVQHKLIIRWRSDVSNTKAAGAYRVLLDSRVLGVQYVRNLDSTLKQYGKDYQELTAEDNSPEVA